MSTKRFSKEHNQTSLSAKLKHSGKIRFTAASRPSNLPLKKKNNKQENVTRVPGVMATIVELAGGGGEEEQKPRNKGRDVYSRQKIKERERERENGISKVEGTMLIRHFLQEDENH